MPRLTGKLQEKGHGSNRISEISIPKTGLLLCGLELIAKEQAGQKAKD
jgi:hypothetical protein